MVYLPFFLVVGTSALRLGLRIPLGSAVALTLAACAGRIVSMADAAFVV